MMRLKIRRATDRLRPRAGGAFSHMAGVAECEGRQMRQGSLEGASTGVDKGSVAALDTGTLGRPPTNDFVSNEFIVHACRCWKCTCCRDEGERGGVGGRAGKSKQLH